MQLPLHLRARISALGELSRPLGETRAARLAEELARDVANDVARSRNPDATINAWIRRLAAEIMEKKRPDARDTTKPRGMRSLADVLPDVSGETF